MTDRDPIEPAKIVDGAGQSAREEFRRELREATAASVRWRARRRGLLRVAAAFLLYAAGAASGYLSRETPASEDTVWGQDPVRRALSTETAAEPARSRQRSLPSRLDAQTLAATVRATLTHERGASKKVRLDAQDESLREIIVRLNQLTGVNFVVHSSLAPDEITLTVNLREVPLRQYLAAIADLEPIAFLARDYGIFVTTTEGIAEDPRVIAPRPWSPRASGPAAAELETKFDGINIDVAAGEAPLADLVASLADQSGLNLVVSPTIDTDHTIDLQLRAGLPLRVVLQALCDAEPSLVFVAREYGLLVTTREELTQGDRVVAPASR